MFQFQRLQIKKKKQTKTMSNESHMQPQIQTGLKPFLTDFLINTKENENLQNKIFFLVTLANQLI